MNAPLNLERENVTIDFTSGNNICPNNGNRNPGYEVRKFINTLLDVIDFFFFELSYFLHSASLIYAETSLVLHFGKKISIKLVINFLDNF